MTTIYITPPPEPHEVTAEQVAAYLLREGWRGPVRKASAPESAYWTWVDGCQFRVELPSDGRATRVQLRRAIKCIALAEDRPARDVLAAIVGPVVGTGGVGCERITADEWWSRAECRKTQEWVAVTMRCRDGSLAFGGWKPARGWAPAGAEGEE